MRTDPCRLWRTLWMSLIVSGLLITPALPAPKEKKEHDPPVPLAWLTAEEYARFEAGRRVFEFPFTPRDGLGPAFNGRNCEVCHHTPTIGGSGPGYRGNIRNVLPTSRDTQGILFHDKSTARGPADVLPENAIVSKRRPSTLMGLGLIEAIPEEALLAHADPDDKDHDGYPWPPSDARRASDAVWIASASSFALRVCGRCPAPRDGDDVAGAGIYCRNNQR